MMRWIIHFLTLDGLGVPENPGTDLVSQCQYQSPILLHQASVSVKNRKQFLSFRRLRHPLPFTLLSQLQAVVRLLFLIRVPTALQDFHKVGYSIARHSPQTEMERVKNISHSTLCATTHSYTSGLLSSHCKYTSGYPCYARSEPISLNAWGSHVDALSAIWHHKISKQSARSHKKETDILVYASAAKT